jgi:hypothetical protein
VTHIDLRTALQSSMPGGYSDLVTRRTGAAVRTVIEHQIAGLADGTVVFLDFSHIGVLDRSCADELLSKLMLPLTADHPSRNGYVVFHGISEDHLETIESVLETHGLALVVQFADGVTRLVGAVTDEERRCWELVMRNGSAPVAAVASETGLSGETCQAMLESLAHRGLLRRDADRFLPLGTAA